MNPDLSKLPMCDQDWETMEKLPDGRRLCARCHHPVTDFRGMSKYEITLLHAMSEERVCGVYSPEHLAPVAPPQPGRFRSGLVTLTLGASLLAARADAQSAQPPATEQAQLPRDASPAKSDEQAPAPAPAAAQTDTLVIRGTVRDAASGAGVSQAMVGIVERGGIRRSAVTDAAGGYTLRLPDPGDGEVLLHFARIGYQTITVRVRGNRHEVHHDVRMSSSVVGLMGIVVRTPGQEHAEELRRVGYSVSRIEGSR
ncbi:MAG TPA: carboxypeptidase regulatory-like domain-containing protein [Longimicrobium sp.]|nr:carboxypeptidase regulatory-like domain-containing protein [Longimicrobium sp.]